MCKPLNNHKMWYLYWSYKFYSNAVPVVKVLYKRKPRLWMGERPMRCSPSWLVLWRFALKCRRSSELIWEVFRVLMSSMGTMSIYIYTMLYAICVCTQRKRYDAFNENGENGIAWAQLNLYLKTGGLDPFRKQPFSTLEMPQKILYYLGV